jgi:uncharacterized glyoxalase superfamily protein PhnB
MSEFSTSERPAPGQAETLRGRALGASLTVADLSTSLVWYRDVVGFAVEREYERDGRIMSVSLKAGAVSLLLNQDDGRRGLHRTKGEGFSLMITTAQDIDALASRIREHGGALQTEPTTTPWGMRMFRLRDPDGFILTISSERLGT